MKTQTKPAVIAAFEKQIGLLKRERAALKEKCDDLSQQNEVLMKNPVLTPEQAAEFSRIRQDYEEMKQQIDKLAVWLRLHKKAEIDLGRHTGKSVADVVIGYMEEGKIQ